MIQDDKNGILEIVLVDCHNVSQLIKSQFQQRKNNTTLCKPMLRKKNFDGKMRRQKENSGEFAKTLIENHELSRSETEFDTSSVNKFQDEQ